MKRFFYYLKIWWMMSKYAFVVFLSNKVAVLIFLLGKILRFSFFIAFLFFLLKGTKSLAGYDIYQVMFFFLTFNLIDVSSQFLFREVYRFRQQVISGTFDLTLAKPINPLFRVLMGGADIVDFITIPPLVFAVWYVGSYLSPSPVTILIYILLIFNGIIIAASFYIFIISFGIITLEVDHATMIYRDIEDLGKLPIDIYREPLKSVVTYLIPIGVMVTLPAKVFMGLISPAGVLTGISLGLGLFFLAVKFWNYAVRFYTSASS